MFRIINGGSFSHHQEGFFMKRSAGLPYYVFLLIRSVSEIQIDTAKFYAKPDSILFIKPNIPYSYHNPEGEYIDDWLHFDCDVGDIDFFPDEMWNASFSCSNSSLLGNYIEQLLWEKNFAPEELRAETTDLLFTILVKYCIFGGIISLCERYMTYRGHIFHLILP